MPQEWDAPIEGPSAVSSSTGSAHEVQQARPASPFSPTGAASSSASPAVGRAADSVHLSEEAQEEQAGHGALAAHHDAGATHGAPAVPPAGRATEVASTQPSKARALEGGASLRRGAHGNRVRQLQEMLNEQTGSELKVDGVMGRSTHDVLRSLQKERGLKVDGVVGRQTLDSLNRWQRSATQQSAGKAAQNGSTASKADRVQPAVQQSLAQRVGKVTERALEKVEHAAGSARKRALEAVEMAKSFRGTMTQKLKGVLPHFTAPGGKNNNCADFVSSVLRNKGMLSSTHAAVKDLKGKLSNSSDWVRVSKDQAQPGDVWLRMYKGGKGHTELVVTPGATKLIGSNNGGTKVQHVNYSHQARPSDFYFRYVGKPRSTSND